MGFLRRIFTSKKLSNAPPPTAPNSKPTKNTKRWSFTKKTHTTASQPNVSNSNSLSTSYAADNSDANKHAIAVAAATAAVAEAALAAAHAAAEVVRLTSGGASAHGGGTHRRWLEAGAAVKIQSTFRGYLARRALRALKALVKLQALVRGHIVRKQTSDMLKRMQTLVRLQARARASRTHKSESFHYNSKFALSHHPVQVPASPNKNKHQLHAFSTKVDGSSALKRCGSHSNFRNIIDLDKPRYDSNWFDCWMEENLRNSHRETPLRTQQVDDEKSDKILEVDTWKPHFNPQQSKKNFQTSQHMLASDYSSQSYMAFNSPSKYSTKATNPNPSLSSGDTLSVSSMKLPAGGDAAVTRTSGNSPQMFSASSRPGNGAKRSPFSPTRSEYLWGFFGGYADHPNYMANTESSLAKVRSQSAPRLRLNFGRYGSTKRSYQDADTFSEKGFAHPASSSINRLGTANLR